MSTLNARFRQEILKATGASDLFELEVIQNLWSGYGKILRIGLADCDKESVVVKHVRLPKAKKHPRGWNTDLSHQRKVRSYEIETYWYKNYARFCDDSCKIPNCLAYDTESDEVLLILEDLDASGFSLRKNSVSMNDIKACLTWLANFHATFLHKKPEGLWKVGTYWHLDTRPDELKVMDDKQLKAAAPQVDEWLNSSPYLTFVHGDAKLANFCFSDNGQGVAAVDFQYVGGGVGVKDVAYFIGSCLYEEDCEKQETTLLNFYFNQLKQALDKKSIKVDFEELEKNWRELYPVAWTDFHRFLKGWSPDHWKINSYSERLARETIAKINKR